MRAWVIVLLAACSHGQAPPPSAKPVPPPKPAPVSQPVRETSLAEVMLAEVKKVLASAQAEVRGCYEAVLTPEYHPDIDLVIRLALRADGTVRRIEVVRMEPDVSGLVACFTGVLSNLKFPSETEDWELEFPVKLRSGGMAEEVKTKAPTKAPKAIPVSP